MTRDTTPDLPGAPHLIAARELWQEAQLQGPRLDQAVARALDPAYWQALVPGLSIGREAAPALQGLRALAPGTVDDTTRRYHDEGYFQLPTMFPPAVVSPMHGAVATLERADWPSVFTWIYDEYWHAPRTAPLVGLLAAILGAGYRQAPYLWTHVVPGRRGATGWPPHADNPGDARRMTVWIPLSDATVDMGCMSLVPQPLMPAADVGRWSERPTIPMREAMDLLRASRALPARAGAVLGWATNVLHWGSPRQADGNPRVSFSMEFLPAAADTIKGSMAAGPAGVPTFEDRLRLVAGNLLLYQRQEPRVGRYVPLAERLLHHLGGALFD